MIIKPNNFCIKKIFTFHKTTIPKEKDDDSQQELISVNSGEL